MSDFDFTSALKKFGRQTVDDQVAATEEEQAPVPGRAPRFDKGTSIAGARIRSREPTVLDKSILAAGTNAADATVGLTEGIMSRLDPNRAIGPNEQFELDKQSLSPMQFARKYGDEAEFARNFESQADSSNQSIQLARREDGRTAGQQVIDRSLAAGGAAVSMTADTAGAIIRAGSGVPGSQNLKLVPGMEKLLNDTANTITDAGSATSKFMNSGKSQFVKNAPALTEQTAAARMADSALELEQSDGGIREQFRRIGRETMISASAYGDNPGAVDDTVSAAVGSMVPSLVAAGGVRSLTTKIVNELGIKGLPKAAIETIATAATVGTLEGAGAYTQTRTEILGMDPQILMNESPLYNELVSKGMNHEQAVALVAEEAALSAQVMTTLVASGISVPFAGFEGGFLTRTGRKFLLELGGESLEGASKKTLEEALKNVPEAALALAKNKSGATLFEAGQDIAGQAIEEGAQGASATFIQNQAVNQYADQTRQSSEGVGTALTEGVIGGIGATAIMQSKEAPALIKDYAKLLTSAATAVGKEIGKPLAKAKAKKAVMAIVAQDVAEIERRFNAAGEIVKAIDRMDAGEEVTPEARAALEKARVKLAPHIKAFLDTNSEEYVERTKRFAKDVVPGSKLQTLAKVMENVQTGVYKEGTKQHFEANEFLLDEMGRINVIIERVQLAAATDTATQETSAGTVRTEAEELQAEAQAQARAAQVAQEFTDQLAQTPLFSEGIKTASQTIQEESYKQEAAGAAPIPIRSLSEILKNPVGIDATRITPEIEAKLPPEVQRAINVVKAIQSPEHAERVEAIKGNRANNREASRKEIFFQSKGLKYGEVASFNDMVSQILYGAINNARTGTSTTKNTQGVDVDVKDIFNDLEALVQHQKNKYEAATESYKYSVANPQATDTSRKFESLSQKSNKFRKDKGTIYINAGKAGSMQTYRSIAEELNTGVRAYNAIIEQFPELFPGAKMQEVSLPVIPEGLPQSARSTQAATQTATQGTANAQTPSQPAAAQPQASQGQQTQPTQVVADSNVDNDPGSASNAVFSDRLSFKDLFKGGTETTFADAVAYLSGLASLDPKDQTLLSMIAASGFARANPNTVIREATPEERAKAKQNKKRTHGWWDPQKNEMVLFEPRVTKILHEMIHAVTLEALFQNLSMAYQKRVAKLPLNRLEQAAVDLNKGALAFMEADPVNEEAAYVQGLMRALVDPTKPLAEQDRGMGRAISEYMAYGLTEKSLETQFAALSAREYKRPEMAKDIIAAVWNLLKVLAQGTLEAVAGTKQESAEPKNTVLNKLFIDTRTLALDSQTTVLQSRQVQRVEAKDVKNVPQEEATPSTAKRETPGEKKTEEPAAAEPAAVRAPVEPTSGKPTSGQFSWARTGGYEVSSAGDKTFSALNATLEDGRTIEMHYQGDVKGYDPGGTNWKLGKGKPPKTDMTREELYRKYLQLWKRWATANPFLMMDLKKKAAAAGGVLSDKFASTDVNQARALSEILNTTFAISNELSTADYDLVSYWAQQSGTGFHNFTIKPKSKKLKDLVEKAIETEGADPGLDDFLDAMLGSAIFGIPGHDMTMEEVGPDKQGNITFRIQDNEGTSVSVGSDTTTKPQPAQAETSSAPAEEVDTTRREEQTEDDGPEQNEPAQEADDLTDQIAQGLLKIIQAAANKVDKPVPSPAAAPVAPAASTTPEASTADAVAPTVAASASVTPAAAQATGLQVKKLEARLAEQTKKVNNLTKTKEARAGEPEADLAALNANLEKAVKAQDEMTAELNKLKAAAPVEVPKAAPELTIEEVVQKAVEPAKAYVPTTAEIDSMLSDLKSEMDDFEKSLNTINDDLESIYNNQFKKTPLYKAAPLTFPQFKAIVKGDTKSAPYKAGVEKLEAAKGTETEQQIDDVLEAATYVADELPRVVEAFETARKVYEYELKAAGRKAETTLTPAMKEVIAEAEGPIAPIAPPANAVFVPAPTQQVLAEPLPPLPETPVNEAVRVEEVNTGLPEGWQPKYKPGSNLLGSPKDGSFVSKILNKLAPILQPGDTFDRLLRHVTPSLYYAFTPEMQKQVGTMRVDAQTMVKGMQARLAEQMPKLKAKNGESLLVQAQKFVNGQTDFNPARSAQYRALAWLDAQSIKDGKPQFDSHLLMLAMMATADYVLQNQDTRGVYKLEDVMEILGLSDASKVTPEMFRMVNMGLPGVLVKDGLAKHIRAFMGAEVNGKVSTSQTDGIFEALAHEILDYLGSQSKDSRDKNFWVQENKIDVFGRTITVFSFGKPAGWLDGAGTNLLKDVLTSKSSDMHKYSIGEKWGSEDVAKRLKKNKSIKVSPKQRRAIQRQQDTPFYWSKDFWEMYESLIDPNGIDSQTLRYMLGFKSMAEDQFYNDMDAEAIAGKNASITYGFKNAKRQIDEIKAYAEKTGVSPWDVPIYYRIAIGENTRFNFEGFNPQQNKFAREMFSPTRHTVDLTDPKAVTKLYAAVAQSLGKKVENLGLAAAAQEAKALLAGEYATIMDILEKGNLADPKARQILINEINRIGLEEDAFTLKGLWTIKKLNQAIARGDTEFETDMYMELDGKTNGPISAAIQYFTGEYSSEILANWRRGGYFLGNAFQDTDELPYFQWRNSIVPSKALTPDPNSSNADFYGRVAELSSTTLIGVQASISQEGGLFESALSPEQVKMANRAFLRTLGFLSFDQNYQVGYGADNQLEVRIKRGATKSPITKNIYGSGLRAISVGLVGDLFGEVYADLTRIGRGGKEGKEALERLRKAADHLDDLFTYDVAYDEFYTTPQTITRSTPKGPSLKATLQSDTPSKELLAKFRFSEDQFERASTSIQAFYGTAFKKALNVAVDPSVERLNKDLIKGSKAHGKLFKKIVDKALKEKHAELVAAGNILSTEELPNEARREVLEAHRDLSPIIDNGVTAFSVIGSETETGTDVSRRIHGQNKRNEKAKKEGKPEIPVDRQFHSHSRTLSGKEIDSRRPTIEIPGVEVLPLNTQTNSDVRMEIETWNNPNYPSNALAVHDGNNQATNAIEQASLVMNEAISVAWRTNTLRPILESYDRALAFVRGMNDLDEATSDLVISLATKRNELLHDVLYRDARIVAEKQIYTSFQGVPGGERAHVQGGLRFNTEAQMIKFLNDETNRVFNQLLLGTPNLIGNVVTETIENEDGSVEYLYDYENIPELKEKIGDKTTFKGEEINQLLRTVMEHAESPEQFAVMEAVLNSVSMKTAIENGLKVVFMPDGYEKYKVLGMYNAYTHELMFTKYHPEMIIHELVHAATMDAILRLYTDTAYQEANPELAEEVDKISKLMKEFLKTNWPTGSDVAFVQTKIASLMKTDLDGSADPLGEMNALFEFVAYALTQNEVFQAISKPLTTPTVKVVSIPYWAPDALSRNKLIRIIQRVTRGIMRLFIPHYKMKEQKQQFASVYDKVVVEAYGDKLFSSTKKILGIPHTGYAKTFMDNLYEMLKQSGGTIPAEELPFLKGFISGSTTAGANNQTDTNEVSRKLNLQSKIGTQVNEYLQARRRGDSEAVTRARRAGNAATYAKAKNDASEALNTMAAAGFTIKGPQDILLFQSLYATVAADMKMDKVALQELQLVYNAVIEKLGTDSFEKFGAQGVSGQLQSTRMYAAVLGQSFFDVTGAREFLPPRGPTGIERLAAFVALAQTAPEMRQILSEMDLSKLNLATAIDTKSNVDALLGSTMANITNRVTGRILESTGNKSVPVNQTLDVLTDLLVEYDLQAASAFETDVSTTLMGINAAMKQGIGSAAVSISNSLQLSASKAESEISATLQNLAAAFIDILDEERASVRAEMTTKLLNKSNMWEPVRNLFAEARAMSEDTAGVLRLVKKAKNSIARVRSEYIENVPRIIRKSFGPDFEALKATEKQRIMKTLFKGLGKTDFVAASKLVGSRSMINLFGTDRVAKEALQSEIRQMKKSISLAAEAMGLPKGVDLAYFKKAEQLADYMVNKKIAPNTLTSAVAIFNLHNEDGLSISETDYKDLQKVIKDRKDPKGKYTDRTRRLIDTIDALASLEAIARLDDSIHNDMVKFVKDHRNAVLKAIDYQTDLHRIESEKVDLTSAAALNGLKGAFLTNSQHKHSVVVATPKQAEYLKELGYSYVRDYVSPVQKFDPAQKQGYYFSAHNSLATYNQGVIQTVQDTYFGVDPRTGMMIGPEATGKQVTGNEMKLLNKRVKAHKGAVYQDGHLPRFGQDGTLLAMQGAVSADVFDLLNQTDDYADSLGRWAGRIQEEKAAHGLNYELVDAAKAMYDRDVKAGRGDEYAAFGRDQKEDGTWDFTDELLEDSVWMESYLLMPRDAREYAEEVFGGPMMVRRDMINNTFGFRSASIGDVFTGKTRMKPELADAIKAVFMATPFLKDNAYKYLTMTEEALQDLVSGVKHIIVVKSGVVMIANTLANVFQLATREVPLSYITKRTRSKWAELEQYKKNEDLKIQLRYDYLASKSNSERANIRARLDSIDEANKKMTIWPLIEANQFTTISEGLTDADTAIFNKGFGDWVERKAGELPGPLSTAARYALVAKDTALYQGLAKGVQYGDFIAKSIYYDFLTEERGVETEKAMLKLDQEFINYDLNDSRLRSYLESTGITWFMNFKIRSLKLALDMLRNNPATALLAMGTGGLIGVGSPLVDNIVSVTMDGRLGYSIGPGMLEAGWNMNFWNQISGNS